MGAFIHNAITAKGLMLLAKGIAGGKIEFSKIVLGDGYLDTGQTPDALTGIISPRVTLDITKFELHQNGTVTVGGTFSNEHLGEGFYYRELGLYAVDPDEGEILYSYGNADKYAEWIPPTGGTSIVEKQIDIVTVVGSAVNVTAIIKSEAFATKADVEACLNASKEALAAAQSAPGVCLLSIILPAFDWEVCEDANFPYCLTLPIEQASSAAFPSVAIAPESLRIAHAAELSPTCESVEGAVKFFAKAAPGADIYAALMLTTPGGGFSQTGGMLLPIATADSIGGVKIPLGSGLRIDADGSLSIDAATAAEVEEIFAAAEIE